MTSWVAHRFQAISTRALIRHLTFSLVLYYSLCALLPAFPVIEERGKCVRDCVCSFVLCVCLVSVSLFSHPHASVCDINKSIMFGLKFAHLLSAFHMCLYMHAIK